MCYNIKPNRSTQDAARTARFMRHFDRMVESFEMQMAFAKSLTANYQIV